MTVAAEAEKPAQAISAELWEWFRSLYRSDPWEFAIDVCGFTRLVERFHKPIIYLLTHQTALLIEVLKGPLRSVVITKIKGALSRKGLDYRDPDDFEAIDEFTTRLNVRVFRKAGKTSCGEAAILWDITVDPNQSWAIVSRDDDSAEEMCAMIGSIVRSDEYRFFFPERIPKDERTDLTQNVVLLSGRTKKVSQPCVTAGGVDSGWVSKHFTRIYGDDLVGRENKSSAKLKIVHEFQANKNGLKVPEWEDAFYDFTIGTRWARNDDAYVLDRDPDCLTIYVMIEDRQKAVTLANMMDAGVPTLPEWFDEKAIRKEKRDYLRDKKLGAVALLANLFLTVAADAAQIFNPAIVDSAKFQWWIEPDGRRFVRRLSLEKPPKGKKPKILKFSVDRDLERKAGADPAASLKGDPWAVSGVGRDPGGVHHHAFMCTGHGTEGFLDALLYCIEEFDPDQIGIEKAAMQDWVLVSIQKDFRFVEHVHKFTPVSTNEQSKRTRATNLVAAPLEQGLLLFDPDDEETPEQCKEWDPDNRRAKDAIIDSLGIAMKLFTTPAAEMSAAEVERQSRADKEEYERSVDDDFGFPVEDVMADDNWLGDDLINFDTEIF